jgi:TPR repeat protein
MFGLGKSDLDKGLDAFQAKLWKRARKHLEQAAAEAPTATGDYHLGLIFWRGLGGERVAHAAVACFERAALQGHVAAQTAYGAALRSGVGVRQDVDEARKLFRSAAGGDDLEAMLQLSTLCQGEEQIRWLTRAADMGHPGAMRALAELLIAEQPVEALAWLYAAAAIAPSEEGRKRAADLAAEMSAAEIDTAQKAGRVIVRNLRKGRGRS